MNAQELFLKTGKSAGVYYCSECLLVRRTEADAERCCAPYTCSYCGTDVPRERRRTICESCERKKREETERLRFEKAKKLTAWGLPVYAPDVGWSDGYFQNVDDLRDHLASHELPVPAYVWACSVCRFVRLETEALLESCYCDAYEDFDPNAIAGVEELSKAVDAFNEQNKHHESWLPDYTTAIVL